MDESKNQGASRESPGISPSEEPLPAGTMVSHYCIVEKLGGGGMGVVYTAEDVKLGRRVALKFLPEELGSDPRSRARFESEARSASALDHPNICPIYEFGEHGGKPFIVMPLLEGKTLRELISGAGAANGPFSLEALLNLSLQICEGLNAAHQKGIIHRDIKPANIFVTHRNEIKILDFGLAKPTGTDARFPDVIVADSEVSESTVSANVATSTPAHETLTIPGAAMGTLAYMSPEQVRGEPLDARTDLFSFGAVLYEMATGERPFPGRNPTLVRDEILQRRPFPVRELKPLLPPGLSRIITRSLEKDRSARYQRASEMQDELSKLAASLRQDAGNRLGRRRYFWLSACGLVIALGVAVGARYQWLHQGGRSAQHSSPSAAPSRRTVAVLGFQNLSGRSDPAWLGTAFSEMLTTELGAGDQLRMVSSEEVARLKTGPALSEGGTLSRETLARIRQTLGADAVVLGSYSDLGRQSGGQIRLDVRVQDTAAGETVATISETGTETELFQLVTRTGARLREKMAIPAISADQAEGLQASLPANTKAERLYAEGLEKLRQFDALAARDLLEQAIQADPNFALAHSALAEAWSQLGYEGKAKSEARESFELSDRLPRKDRLLIEATYRRLNNEWDKAVDLYRTLFDFFPDESEYGMYLANAQTQAGKGNEALATIQLLRQLPAPVRHDARIDLAEEEVYNQLGQYSQAHSAAVRAVEEARAGGTGPLLAKTLYRESYDLAALGEGDQAIAVAEEAKKIYSGVGDQVGVAEALESIAYVQRTRGDWEGAEKLYQQELLIDRTIGNKTRSATDLRNLAEMRQERGDVESAKKLVEEALEIYREVGDKEREARALIDFAAMVESQGDLVGALHLEDQALAVFREMADDEGIAYALDGQADQLTMLGELGKAQEASQQSFKLIGKGGNKSMIGQVRYRSGHIAMLQGNLQQARETFSEALPLTREAGDSGLTATLELGLAEVAWEENQQEEANRRIIDLLSSLREHKDPSTEIAAESLLARIALREGDTTTATRAIATARSLLGQISGWEERFIFGIGNARVLAAIGKINEAREALGTVITETTKQRNMRYQLEAQLALCEIEAKTDLVSARAHARTLGKVAESRGFGLIARKALALAT